MAEKYISGRESEIDYFISLIAENDKLAIESVYAETKTAVYGFALSIVQDVKAAEEVMRETYTKVFSSAQKYVPNGKPMVWILSITRDLALAKQVESSGAGVSLEFDREETPDENDFQRTLDQFVLKTALSNLDEDDRQIIMLQDVAGMKPGETAALLELPLPVVLLKYPRALSKLKRHLKELI